MNKFFVEELASPRITISGKLAGHISKSLRLGIGNTIILCDGKGHDCDGIITSVDGSDIILSVNNIRLSSGELPIKIALYYALPKSDKIEYVTQKAVELGVHEIVPFVSEFCVSRPSADAGAKKTDRLRRISLEAAQQSGRGIIPNVYNIMSFDNAVKRARESSDAVLFCWEKATTGIKSVLRDKISRMGTQVAVFIGSEGGFSDKEAEQALLSGFEMISFGERILRTETAPIYALSVIAYEYS